MNVLNLAVKFREYCLSIDLYMGKLKLVSTITTLTVLITALNTPAYGETEYYTWVDENGVTNYAQKNPTGYEAEHITSQARFGYSRYRQAQEESEEPADDSTSDDGANADNVAPAGDPNAEGFIAKERARIDAEIAKAKSTNCGIGKRNLAQLEAYARIKVRGDDGGVTILSDAEKAAKIADAKKTIKENCTG